MPLFEVSLEIRRAKKYTHYTYSDMKVVKHRPKSQLLSRKLAVPIKISGEIDKEHLLTNLQDAATVRADINVDQDPIEVIYELIDKDTQ